MGNQQLDPWLFNYRSIPPNESDSGDETTELNTSEESRLWSDLDISSRKDTAVYKPNPFSIAKINASCRSRTTMQPGSIGSEPPKKSGTIERFFDQSKQRILPGGRTLVAIEGSSVHLAKPPGPHPTMTSNPNQKNSPASVFIQKSAALTPATTNKLEWQGPGLPLDAHISTKCLNSTAISDHGSRPLTGVPSAPPVPQRLHTSRPISESHTLESNKNTSYVIPQLAPSPRLPRDARAAKNAQSFTKPYRLGQKMQAPSNARWLVAKSRPPNIQSSVASGLNITSPNSGSLVDTVVAFSDRIPPGIKGTDSGPGSATPGLSICRGLSTRQKDRKDFSTSLGPSETHTRLPASRTPKCYDGEVDEDETWSTLPPRKKFKPSIRPPPRNKNSGPFRIPGLKANPNGSSETATPSARVITFLPTPLLPQNQLGERRTMLKNSTQQFSSPQTSPSSHQIFDLDEGHRSSSPPTSEAVQTDWDACIEWDLDDTRNRYARIVETVEEHWKSKEFIRDFLGLPNCYRINCHNEESGGELPIKLWP